MTDRQLADKAETAAKATTITYADWERRKAQGMYADVTKTEWHKLFDALGQIGKVAPPPVDPPASNVVLDAFEIVMEPNNHEDTPGSNRYSYGWTEWTSPVTPKPMPNGEPAGRGLRKGERYWVLKGYKFLTDEGCGRLNNRHSWAVPGVGWETEVSSMATDCYDTGTVSKSGASFEVNLEYERTQDIYDSEKHYGGMSVAYPAYFAARNAWHWELTDLKLGGNADGIYSVWDWVTGQLLIDLKGVNTLSPKQSGCQGWEGGYNSSGVDRTARCLQTPGLYARYEDGVQVVLTDKPKLVKSWHSVSTGGGASSRVNLGVEKVTVPAGKLS